MIRNTLIALAAFAAVSSASFAQTVQNVYASGSVSSNTVAANSTNTLSTIQATKTDKIALQLQVSSTNSAAAAAVSCTFQTSTDGSIWDTTAIAIPSATLNGTNIVRGLITNITIGAVGYIRPVVVNTGATTYSVSVRYAKKPGY